MEINEAYLKSAVRQFTTYKSLGEKAMAQMEPGALFKVLNEDSNSVATIVKHLHGNMLSRWTDFLTTDGEKEWRERDAEFENDITTKEEMMKLWEEGWGCLFNALHALTPAQLSDTIYIRAEAHSVMEAINRQIAHYAYHVGQIVFLAKIFHQGAWQTLSIAKGQSKQYNAGKFTGGK